METKGLEYFIFCSSDTRNIGTLVEELIKKRPNHEIIKDTFTTAPYFLSNTTQSREQAGTLFIKEIWMSKVK